MAPAARVVGYVRVSPSEQAQSGAGLAVVAVGDHSGRGRPARLAPGGSGSARRRRCLRQEHDRTCRTRRRDPDYRRRRSPSARSPNWTALPDPCSISPTSWRLSRRKQWALVALDLGVDTTIPGEIVGAPDGDLRAVRAPPIRLLHPSGSGGEEGIRGTSGPTGRAGGRGRRASDSPLLSSRDPPRHRVSPQPVRCLLPSMILLRGR